MSVERMQHFLGLTAVVASPAMRRVIDLVQRVARTSAAVLITGETGTGKEVVARAVHHFSVRAAKPWVDVNCGALPDALMESELFGHERGAFSGADIARPGLFELAHTGTLFLDEIGELDPRMQVKLLRVLDGVGYYRVGGRRKVEVNARIVAATNQNLEMAVETGRFRSDLFHRLNQCPVRVPPLRERREDIIPIAEFFLSQHSEPVTLTQSAQDLLTQHDWPGNVRQLRNTVIGAVVRVNHPWIEAADLDLTLARTRTSIAAGELRLDGLEREAIVEALRKTAGHCQRAADLLGISRRTLSRKLKTYGPEIREEVLSEYESTTTH
jgi:DNA-binding NtrC family response regulator